MFNSISLCRICVKVFACLFSISNWKSLFSRIFSLFSFYLKKIKIKLFQCKIFRKIAIFSIATLCWEHACLDSASTFQHMPATLVQVLIISFITVITWLLFLPPFSFPFLSINHTIVKLNFESTNLRKLTTHSQWCVEASNLIDVVGMN